MASRNDGPRAYSDRMATARVDEVRRLAQYRPFDRGGLDLQAVLHDLVVALAALNDGTVGSLLHCRKDFQDVWGLVVEVDELRPVFERLVTQGSAKKHGKGIRLSSTVLAELKSRADESEQTEARAMKEWEAEVRRMQPGLSDEDMAALRADLRQWLEAIIARHGAEAAMMLYPEQERARRFFDAVDGRAFESLPERADELAALRERALPTFIRASTPDQRQHLANLLNTGFYMTVLTIDPAARELVQEQLRGRRIYLDTNFLYAILGAARAEEVYSARRLLELTRGLGFELAVTPWTMKELRTSIAGSRREIEKHGQEGLIRPQYAATMLGTSSEKGFQPLLLADLPRQADQAEGLLRPPRALRPDAVRALRHQGGRRRLHGDRAAGRAHPEVRGAAASAPLAVDQGASRRRARRQVPPPGREAPRQRPHALLERTVLVPHPRH